MAMEEGYNKTEILKLNGIYNYKNKIVCYQPSLITTNGLWQKQNPLDYSLPLFILQLMIIVITTEFVVYIAKRLHQPSVVAEIIAGILMGPSGFGAIEWIGNNILPLRSMMVLDTMANIGLLYYLFLVGIEMDVSLVRRSNQQTLIIAGICFLFPLAISIFMSLVAKYYILPIVPKQMVYVCVSISLTAFPVMSRILVELKLFNTELGRKALSASLIVDLFGWLLIAIGSGWMNPYNSNRNPYVVLICVLSFLLLSVMAIRPAILWVIKHTPEGENFSEFYICLILTGVMICGFIAETIGTHPVIGAFIFGLTIPNGSLGTALLEKLEDFVTKLMLPLFFAVSGIRFEITAWGWPTSILVLVIIFANLLKVVGLVFFAPYLDMQIYEALSLGLLMNTKGIIEMVVLNVGVAHQVLSPRMFVGMVISVIMLTLVTTPVIQGLYMTTRRFMSYKRRKVQSSRDDTELRILTCIHATRNVPTMINLLKASHATKRSPISVYALHLMELTDRASAMLTFHNIGKRSAKRHNTIRESQSQSQSQSENIVNAFEDYTQEVTNANVQLVTTISPHSTMHEDICNLAVDNHIAFIIVPFHKQQTVDGGMESTNPTLRNINQNVLANAPCSVGILIDKGLSGSSRDTFYDIAIIFIGGPDDQEALSYGWRMAGDPTVKLTVLQFIPGNATMKPTITQGRLKLIFDMERETQQDDELVNKFRQKTMGAETIMYKKVVVESSEDIVAAIRGMHSSHDLYIVGRGQGIDHPLRTGLTESSECLELGAIGNLLTFSDFGVIASILVVQQYVGDNVHGDGTIVSPAGNSTSFNFPQRS